MDELESRADFTERTVSSIRDAISNARQLLVGGGACLVATGSVGRREASKHSDLDLMIITRSECNEGAPDNPRSTLSPLDEICIKSDVIRAIRALGIKELDGRGRFFRRYTINQLTDSIGQQRDDSDNTLTSRLLLILESRAIEEGHIRDVAIKSITQAYWADYERHEHEYIPAFLTNDILRLWRTFCVNYEARTKGLSAERRMEKKIKNLKLKYSRMLTCYSAIIYLLDEFTKHKTVSMEAGILMAAKTPIERLRYVQSSNPTKQIKTAIDDIVDRYESFLSITNRPEGELIEHMTSNFDDMRSQAHEFGDKVFEVLTEVGQGNRFHRLIVV